MPLLGGRYNGSSVTRRQFLHVATASPLAAQDILRSSPPKADARVSYGKAPAQFGDLRMPAGAGPHPIVIFYHGGFWRNTYSLDYAGHACAALARAGVATWNVEYRRIGDAGGGWPGTLDDAVHGAEFITILAKRYSIDLRRILVAGHSAGGQLALWLTIQRPVDLRGVVALAPVSDLRRAFALHLGDGAVAQFIGGSPDRLPQRYAATSPIQLLPISVPQRIIHGTKDDIIPFEMSERFAQASHNAKLIPIQGAGHFELVDPRTRDWKIVEKNFLNWEF